MVKRSTYKFWKIVLYSILIPLIINSFTLAQKISGNFIVDENSDSLFVGRIQVSIDEGSSAIGNAVIRYKFNPNRLEYPENPEEGKDFSIYNFQNGEYIASISHPSEDVISINIAKLFGNDIIIGTGPIDVAEVIFSVKNTEVSNEFQSDVIQFFSPLSSEMWELGDWVVSEGNNTFEFVNLLLPENGAKNVSSSVDLEWNSIEDAQTYHLQISKKNDFSEIVYENDKLTNTKINIELEDNTEYFWRIRYTNSAGTSSFSSNFSFITAQEVPQVVLRTPINDSTVIGSSVWFKWKSVTGRDFYQLQIATDEEFNNIERFLDTLQINEIEVHNIPAGQEYFWRARASMNSVLGKYSDPNRFNIAHTDTVRPILVLPENGQTDVNTTITFNWDQIDSAIFYQLEIAEDHNFDDMFYVNENVETNEQTVYYFDKGKQYFWRVRFVSPSGKSMYSNVSVFETSEGMPTTPIVLTPLNNSVDLETEIQFSWKNEGYADRFIIEIYTDSGIQNLFYSNDSITTNNITLNMFEQGQTYFWRVRSANNNGNSRYSDLSKFRTRTGKPSILVLLEPLNNSVGLESNVRFKWNPIDSALYYKIEISKYSDFHNFIRVQDSIFSTEISVSGLEENMQYYWRIKSQNQLGSSTFSNIFNFSTHMGLPALPVAMYPTNNDPNVDNNVSFNWTVVEGAENYHVEIARDGQFKNIIFTEDTISTNELTLNSIGEGKEYYWRVKAKNAHGNSTFSEANKFTVKVNKPSDLMSKIIDNEYVRLSWRDNSKVEKRIIIERKLKEEYKHTRFEIIDTVASDLIYYYDHSAVDGEKYIYRVFSENNVSSSDYSNDVELLFSIKKVDPNIPEDYTLSQNYPNPFNPSTKINYSVKELSNIGIKIYNIIGEEVTTLVSEIQDPGNYTIDWDASTFASGVYLYVMTATSRKTEEKFHAVNKMMLVK